MKLASQNRGGETSRCYDEVSGLRHKGVFATQTSSNSSCETVAEETALAAARDCQNSLKRSGVHSSQLHVQNPAVLRFMQAVEAKEINMAATVALGATVVEQRPQEMPIQVAVKPNPAVEQFKMAVEAKHAQMMSDLQKKRDPAGHDAAFAEPFGSDSGAVDKNAAVEATTSKQTSSAVERFKRLVESNFQSRQDRTPEPRQRHAQNVEPNACPAWFFGTESSPVGVIEHALNNTADPGSSMHCRRREWVDSSISDDDDGRVFDDDDFSVDFLHLACVPPSWLLDAFGTWGQHVLSELGKRRRTDVESLDNNCKQAAENAGVCLEDVVVPPPVPAVLSASSSAESVVVNPLLREDWFSLENRTLAEESAAILIQEITSSSLATETPDAVVDQLGDRRSSYEAEAQQMQLQSDQEQRSGRSSLRLHAFDGSVPILKRVLELVDVLRSSRPYRTYKRIKAELLEEFPSAVFEQHKSTIIRYLKETETDCVQPLLRSNKGMKAPRWTSGRKECAFASGRGLHCRRAVSAPPRRCTTFGWDRESSAIHHHHTEKHAQYGEQWTPDHLERAVHLVREIFSSPVLQRVAEVLDSFGESPTTVTVGASSENIDPSPQVPGGAPLQCTEQPALDSDRGISGTASSSSATRPGERCCLRTFKCMSYGKLHAHLLMQYPATTFEAHKGTIREYLNLCRTAQGNPSVGDTFVLACQMVDLEVGTDDVVSSETVKAQALTDPHATVLRAAPSVEGGETTTSEKVVALATEKEEVLSKLAVSVQSFWVSGPSVFRRDQVLQRAIELVSTWDLSPKVFVTYARLKEQLITEYSRAEFQTRKHAVQNFVRLVYYKSLL